VSGHAGRHEWKAGADADFASIRERFGYLVTDASQFDSDTPPEFAFADRKPDREQALFVQDHIRAGNWTINAGLRWDRYHLLVDETALSPRAGIAWSWPAHDVVFRASYDRAFQTPAVENLLLASAPELGGPGDDVVRLPVPTSRGNFYEVGASARVAANVRVDVTRFWRRIGNFADDDLLLNTGVSFPIAFDKARIAGTEIKLDLLRWREVSASLSYSNMRGVGYLPITGGLLLEDSSALLESADRFPISQDQRHTVRGRVSYDLSSRVSVSAAGSYGSGLPVEFAGTAEQALEQYGPRILQRVDLDAGRVRPSFALDASLSAIVLQSDHRCVRIQADVRNLTDRLNVINFAGLFSGTAIGPPRTGAVRVQFAF
jgi:outer membrane receptor protein involved in Fe transport